MYIHNHICATVQKLFGLTFEPFAFGDSNDVDHFVGVEDLLHIDGLLEVFASPVHLVRDSSTVDLYLHDVGLLLVQALDHAQLRVGGCDNVGNDTCTLKILTIILFRDKFNMSGR